MSSRVCLIIYDLPVYISSCLFSLMWSGLLVIPGVSCLWVLPCPVMSSPDVFIKYYNLSLYPRLRVPVPPSCVHRDRRPDHNRKRRPFTPFCFRFLKSFYFVPVCLSRDKEVAARHSRHSPLQVGVGVRRDRRECRESSGREPSSPPAACLVHGLPLPQARRSREITPPHRLWLNARRPASDSMPAGPRCPKARRIAADSSPPDCRWLKHWIGVDSCPLAAAIPSPVDQVHMSRPGVPCVCLVVPTGTF